MAYMRPPRTLNNNNTKYYDDNFTTDYKKICDFTLMGRYVCRLDTFLRRP